jgi:acyl carrier protein
MSQTVEIKTFIGNFLRLPTEKIADTSTLADLVADSFQAVELLVALQDEFGFMLSHDDLARIETLSGLLSLIELKQ